MKAHLHRGLGLLVGVVTTLLLGSCALPGTGDSGDALVDDLALSQSTYQILDLATGQLTSLTQVQDLTTNTDYRSNRIVFRLVPAGSSLQGAASGALGDGGDAVGQSVSTPFFYIGVFEVTQAQWQLLAGGGLPWTTAAVTPSGSAGALTNDSDHPAYHLSRTLVDSALQAFNTGKVHTLALPTDGQWERACRGGTTTPFHWGGDASNRSAAVPYCVVAETRGSTTGPQDVGTRLPNPFGLYDMHGNVWELTHTGTSTSLRGGSWYDPLVLGRSSHVMPVDRGTAHVLAGVRLILVP